MFKYLAVLDFEATCWKNRNEHEIIEFPTVIIDIENKMIIDRFQVFVKPVKEPILSPFCTELTGIQQSWVDQGATLQDALEQHAKFMSKYENSIIVTCGDWDLNVMLPKDLACKNISPGNASFYKTWINIKKVFAERYSLRRRQMGMVGMLHILKMEVEGRHHSGIDDCTNIARIAVKLLEAGWDPVPTTN